VVKASCHCGAVRFEVADLPAAVTSCNCSMCRRTGALWAYYHPDQVRFDASPNATATYVHGDRTLALHHCRTCGCITHWVSIETPPIDRMGVNARLFETDISGIKIRRFDGADSWTYPDEV
jgi:hypothetical protein